MEKEKLFKRLSFQSRSLEKPNFIENEPKTFISIFNQRNRTGIAIFDEVKDQIITSSVVEIEANDYQNLFKFLASYPNSKFIVPQRCNSEFWDVLVEIQNFNTLNEKENCPEDEPRSKSKDDLLESMEVENIISISKGDYDYQFAVDCLLSANFEGVLEAEDQIMDSGLKTPFFDNKAKLAEIRGILDLDNEQMMCALGGLLNFLFQTSRLKTNFPIGKIKMKQPQKNIYITMKTYNSLSIIKEHVHPSQIKGKGKSKEGFSVLNLYDSMISTTHGKKLLRNWFLNPTYEIDILEERLYTVSFLLSKLSSVNFDKTKKFLKKIYDVTLVLKGFKNDTATKEHWKKLESTLENFLLIKDLYENFVECLSSNEDKLPPVIITKVLSFDVSDLIEMQLMLEAVLKIEDNTDKIEVNAGVSEELDDLKTLYSNMDEILTFYARQELEKLLDAENQRLGMSYMPHFGYLVSIPKTEQDIEEGTEEVKIEEEVEEKEEEEGSEDQDEDFSLSGHQILSRKNYLNTSDSVNIF